MQLSINSKVASPCKCRVEHSIIGGVKNIKISYSRVQSYLRCPYQHYLRYYEHLRLNRPVKPLYFGSDFHKLLELRGDKKALKQAKKDITDKYYEIPAQWQGDLGEDYVENLFNIFSDYTKVYEGAPLPQKTEEPFEIPIGKYKGEPVEFIGVIDELYLRKKNGKKYIKIGEHKTFSRKPNADTLIMNTQKCLYAKATQITRGILPQAVIWDYISSKPASSPIWLEKSQRFSTSAKNSYITPYSWVRACKERGILDEQILQEGEKFRGNIPNFYFRREMELIPAMVEQVWEDFIYTCKGIAKEGHKNTTKNFTKDCAFCNYRDICYTQCTGGDLNYLIDKNYTRKEYTEETSDKIET